MVSRKLMLTWGFLDFFMLAAGAICIAFSVIWKANNLHINMVLDNNDLTAGMVLGVMFLISFVCSIIAILQPNHSVKPLKALNWVLLLDVLSVGTVGSYVWFFTLRERDAFHKVWLALSDGDKISLQDEFKCCGYFNAADSAVVGGTFCTQAQVSFLNTLDTFAPSNPDLFCVKPITNFADVTLNNVFSSVYGFMAIVLCLILATLCVINKRLEDERFKKIDAKRGGRGFV